MAKSNIVAIVIAVIAIGYKELKNFRNEEIKSIKEKRKTK